MSKRIFHVFPFSSKLITNLEALLISAGRYRGFHSYVGFFENAIFIEFAGEQYNIIVFIKNSDAWYTNDDSFILGQIKPCSGGTSALLELMYNEFYLNTNESIRDKDFEQNVVRTQPVQNIVRTAVAGVISFLLQKKLGTKEPALPKLHQIISTTDNGFYLRAKEDDEITNLFYTEENTWCMLRGLWPAYVLGEEPILDHLFDLYKDALREEPKLLNSFEHANEQQLEHFFACRWKGITKELEFSREWSDGVGNFDYLVHGANFPVFGETVVAKSTSPGGKRIVIIGTALGNVAIWDQFDSKERAQGNHGFYCATTQRFKIAEWIKGTELTLEELQLLLGKNSLTHNIGWRLKQLYTAMKKAR